MRGKVKHTGEIHLSTKPEQVNGGTEKAMVGAREDSSGEGSGAVTSFLGHGGSAADIVAEGEGGDADEKSIITAFATIHFSDQRSLGLTRMVLNYLPGSMRWTT